MFKTDLDHIKLRLMLILSFHLRQRISQHFEEWHNCFFYEEQHADSGRAVVELMLCKYECEGCTCRAGCGDKGWVAQYRFLAWSTGGHGHRAEELLQYGGRTRKQNTENKWNKQKEACRQQKSKGDRERITERSKDWKRWSGKKSGPREIISVKIEFVVVIFIIISFIFYSLFKSWQYPI